MVNGFRLLILDTCCRDVLFFGFKNVVKEIGDWVEERRDKITSRLANSATKQHEANSLNAEKDGLYKISTMVNVNDVVKGLYDLIESGNVKIAVEVAKEAEKFLMKEQERLRQEELLPENNSRNANQDLQINNENRRDGTSPNSGAITPEDDRDSNVSRKTPELDQQNDAASYRDW